MLVNTFCMLSVHREDYRRGCPVVPSFLFVFLGGGGVVSLINPLSTALNMKRAPFFILLVY